MIAHKNNTDASSQAQLIPLQQPRLGLSAELTMCVWLFVCVSVYDRLARMWPTFRWKYFI